MDEVRAGEKEDQGKASLVEGSVFRLKPASFMKYSTQSITMRRLYYELIIGYFQLEAQMIAASVLGFHSKHIFLRSVDKLRSLKDCLYIEGIG